MPRVVLLAEAEEDLAEAAAFLETRVAGLGERLVGAVEGALARLADHPGQGPRLPGGFRKLRVPSFPYDLIYRARPDDTLVVAVAHHRRDVYWTRRG